MAGRHHYVRVPDSRVGWADKRIMNLPQWYLCDTARRVCRVGRYIVRVRHSPGDQSRRPCCARAVGVGRLGQVLFGLALGALPRCRRPPQNSRDQFALRA
jgi:hypothetical protein